MQNLPKRQRRKTPTPKHIEDERQVERILEIGQQEEFLTTEEYRTALRHLEVLTKCFRLMRWEAQKASHRAGFTEKATRRAILELAKNPGELGRAYLGDFPDGERIPPPLWMNRRPRL